MRRNRDAKTASLAAGRGIGANAKPASYRPTLLQTTSTNIPRPFCDRLPNRDTSHLASHFIDVGERISVSPRPQTLKQKRAKPDCLPRLIDRNSEVRPSIFPVHAISTFEALNCLFVAVLNTQHPRTSESSQYPPFQL